VNPALVAAAARLPADQWLTFVAQLEAETSVVVVELVEGAAGDVAADVRDKRSGTRRRWLAPYAQSGTSRRPDS
jgi:hypothetical protein